MTLAPRTLAGRTMLLVFAAVLLCEAVTFVAFDYHRHQREHEHFTEIVASTVNSMQTVLGQLSPTARADFLRSMQNNRTFHLKRGDEKPSLADDSTPNSLHRFLLRDIRERLQTRLGPETLVRVGDADGTHALWISFSVHGERWWLVFTRAPATTTHLPWQVLVALVAIVGVVLGLSAAFALHIARPLRELTGAAAALGIGQPRAAQPAGPEEVRRLADAFNQMLQALQRAERERSAMLAGLPHDLRAPLTRFKLRVGLIEDAALQHGLMRDAEDMTRIADQFLAYLRGEAEEAPQNQSFSAIAREAIEAQRLQGREVASDISTEAILPLRALAMRRLVDNLIDNAFQHGATPVSVAIAEHDGSVVVRVRDHGPGIAEFDRARAQQPFEQLDTARGASGCGLGLAIVERITRAHGGNVTLSSPPDGGLEVTTRLPIDWNRTKRD